MSNDIATDNSRYITLLSCVFVLFLLPNLVCAQLNRSLPEDVKNVGIDEHLGDIIPLDLVFATSTGDSVSLRELLIEEKPLLLNPVYYECPMLCSMVTEAVYTGVRQLAWTPGKDYTIITFSIDPDEGTELAAKTKADYIERLERPGAENGWHFLTGKEHSIKALTEAIGFGYEKIERTGEYAHTASIMFLSSEGALTRYLYGIKYDEFSFRNALYEAADGRIGSTVDKLVLYCYQYDPESQSYVPVAWRIMKLGGLATVIILGIFLGFLWLNEKRKTQQPLTNDPNGSTQ